MPNRTVQSFHNQSKASNSQQHSPIGSVDSNSSNSLMPINVKGMLLHGVNDAEVLRSWLVSIRCDEYLRNFLDNGYDMPLLTRMTPQDLAAVGCKSPALRKKLMLEIKKLNLEDDIPDSRPHSLEKWLELLKLAEYQPRLCDEGYDTIDKVCELTWEDLEEIGMTKLGHQKRLLLGIERVKKFDRIQEDRLADNPIYDVHPNLRVSLNGGARSSLMHSRSGPNLDHRGHPVATVMPALKHVSSAMANLDISSRSAKPAAATLARAHANSIYGVYSPQLNTSSNQILRLSDSNATLRRNPPPLPPVRTNSLKMPQNGLDPSMTNGSIYGAAYSVTSECSMQPALTQTGPTSFLRTPKLGTLTATTNKMLTSGGHIQTISGQPATIRSIFPLREAPLPPMQMHSSGAPVSIDEENALPMQTLAPAISNSNHLPAESHINLPMPACVDEFPPPPPCQ